MARPRGRPPGRELPESHSQHIREAKRFHSEWDLASARIMDAIAHGETEAAEEIYKQFLASRRTELPVFLNKLLNKAQEDR